MSSVTAERYVLPPSHVQAQVLNLVTLYVEHFHQPCSSTVIAHALGRTRTTIRDHFAALHRKGWLLSGGGKAVPAKPFLKRQD